jgi:glutaredoxin
MKKLEIWSSEHCGYCTRLYNLLDHLRIEYDVMPIDEGEIYMKAWQCFMEEYGVYTVPQIMVLDADQKENGLNTHLGGYQDFLKLVDSGEIWEILNDED